jgi:hypothetical protein
METLKLNAKKFADFLVKNKNSFISKVNFYYLLLVLIFLLLNLLLLLILLLLLLLL